jgi:hypothetical protein
LPHPIPSMEEMLMIGRYLGEVVPHQHLRAHRSVARDAEADNG